MRVILLYALVVVALVIPGINVATISNKLRRMVRTVKLPNPRKLVKNPNQAPTIGRRCWSRGNVILSVMDEGPHKSRATWVQKGKRGRPSIK